jgi:hypothetical protein
MPDTGMRRAGAVLDLARRYVPREVESASEFTDWNVVAPGLIGGAGALLESIFQLPPPRHGPAAEILARSLVDYAITFAWLAAAETEDELADRLARFELYEYQERERADAKYVRVLPERSERYTALIRAGKMPSHLISEVMKARIGERRHEAATTAMPPILDRAVEADARWLPEIRALESNPLAGIYASAYASFSFVSHASVTAISRVVVGSGRRLRVGEPAAWTEATGPYGFSISMFVVMLVIASRTLGWPLEDDIYNAARLRIVGPAPSPPPEDLAPDNPPGEMRR